MPKLNILLVLLASAISLAAWAHSDKPHQEPAPPPPKVESSGAGHEDHSRHRHSSWEPAPPAYAGKRHEGWAETAAAARGEQIYMARCASCHGASGVGDGPAGAGLAHKPADLTNHFHLAPGKGDDYLFWRVSEGGVVEPFRSQQSAMPPFKGVLSEQQRWDVLTYIHQEFHKGFKEDGHRGHH